MVGIFEAAKLNLAARYFAELGVDPAFGVWWASQEGQPGRYEALLAYFARRGYGGQAAQILDRVTQDVRQAQRARMQPRTGTSAAQFAPGRVPRRRRRSRATTARGRATTARSSRSGRARSSRKGRATTARRSRSGRRT